MEEKTNKPGGVKRTHLKTMLLVSMSLLAASPTVYAGTANMSSNITVNGVDNCAVSGTVQDASGQPIIGGTVKVKGTTKAVVSDVNGHYSLDVPQGSTLVFSYIGYSDKEVKVNNGGDLNVTLHENDHTLNDVVVVGYSTNKKVNLSGAVSSISADVLSARPIVNVSTALQGLAPGVTVTTQTGEPGADGGNIRIRGIGTFGGDSAAPLVLIDGVEGSIDEVDPNVIESVSVLKDAASASIYGSRAANGVILITTKRGQGNKFSLTYKGYVGFQKPTDLPDKVDAIDWMKLENVAYTNDGAEAPYSDAYIEEYKQKMATDPDNYPNTDWQKLTLTESGFNFGHTVSMTNSSDRIKILTTLGYNEQNGIIINSSFRKIFLRNNMDIQLTKRLKMKLDFQVSNSNKHSSPYEYHAFNYMNTRSPNIVNQFSTGLYNGSGLTGNNSIIMLRDGGTNRINYIRANASLGFDFKIMDGWNIFAQLTPRYITRNQHKYINSVTTYGDPEGTTSFKSDKGYNSLDEIAHRYFYWDAQAYTTWLHQFGDHNLKVMVGAETETYDHKLLSVYRQVFNYPQYYQIDAGNIENMNNGGDETEWAINSYFGRLNYNYKERYLLEANLRSDGSSRFAKENRYSTFPSFSGAWRISQEPWMKNVKAIQNLKVRASWGKLGNQNIGSSYYPTIQSLTTSTISMNDKLYPTAILTSLANTDLHWETSTMTDVGLDANIFDCLALTADWYYKITDGILMKLDQPLIIGFGSPYQNAGKVKNTGWELGVSFNKQWGEFILGVNANLSDVHNEIVDMHGTTSTNGDIRNQEGSAINSIYGLKCLGFVNSQEEADEINKNCPQFGTKVHPGDLKYLDVNNDHKITTDDKTIIGSTIPRYTYSGNISLDWKNWHLGIFLQGVGKADGYLNSYYVMPCYQVVLTVRSISTTGERTTRMLLHQDFPMQAATIPIRHLSG